MRKQWSLPAVTVGWPSGSKYVPFQFTVQHYFFSFVFLFLLEFFHSCHLVFLECGREENAHTNLFLKGKTYENPQTIFQETMWTFPYLIYIRKYKLQVNFLVFKNIVWRIHCCALNNSVIHSRKYGEEFDCQHHSYGKMKFEIIFVK